MRAHYLPFILLVLSSPALAQSRVLEPDLIWETPSSLREKGFQVQDLGEIPPLLTVDGMASRRVYRAYSRDMEQIIDCLVWGKGDAHRCWIQRQG